MSEPVPLVDQITGEVERILGERSRPPEATYRLQFRPGYFTFRDAAAVIPYLQALGVSHVYASPYAKARSSSPHGYAVVDYGSLNPELGTPDDYRSMVEAIRDGGMGQILDIVPNHMSAAPGENAWWNDVLENGPSSPFAAYFDIEWEPVKEELRNKILLPLLGEQYGQVLESGELRLEYRDGAFSIRCHQMVLPVDPKTCAVVLAHRLDELKQQLPADSDELRELESILTALEYLPERTETAAPRVAERQREKEVVKTRLRRLTETSLVIAALIDRNVREFNGTPDDPASFDRLDRLLDAQVYRLAHWKAADDEINYRRFFDINELAAICTEDPDVFQKSHQFVLDLLAQGSLSGLRVDHIDGLLDPAEYLWRLQRGYLRALLRAAWERPGTPAAAAPPPPGGAEAGQPRTWADWEPALVEALWRKLGGPPAGPAASAVFYASADQSPPTTPPPADSPGGTACACSAFRPPLYVVVEKILGPDEPLPSDWPVAGTTGYDFLNLLGGLFVYPPGLADLTRTYRRFVGEQAHFAEVVCQSKLLTVRIAMASELHLLGHRLNRLSEHHRRFRDFTLHALRVALREILACFPVYRTYIRPGTISERDRRFVHRAVAQAKRRNPAMSAAVYDFIRDVLLLEQPPNLDAAGRRDRAMFVGRFQQVTSPVMAKGVEDTAFYRYFPLVSLNEVGGDPTRAAVTVADFHRENLARQAAWPCTLICTTTHDTKRSEDVRARIHVLAEIPQMWRRAVSRFARLNRRHRREVDGLPAPSRNDEYLFYQTLVGVWPLADPHGDALRGLVHRMQQYMEKATREAKQRTSWLSPHPDYDAAVRDFVALALQDHPRNGFLAALRDFHGRIVAAGLYSAISQTVLKLTAPGVPDIYQGQEIWNFSLVDPDNRRPVDFARRERLLAELRREVGQGDEALLALARRLAHAPTDDRLKLFVTWRTLRFRRDHPEWFRQGTYAPLAVEGAKADCVCAFQWHLARHAVDAQRMVVVVPRFLARLTGVGDNAVGTAPPPLGAGIWQDTRIACADAAAMPMTNLFTGQPWPAGTDSLPLASLLADFPVAILVGPTLT